MLAWMLQVDAVAFGGDVLCTRIQVYEDDDACRLLCLSILLELYECSSTKRTYEKRDMGSFSSSCSVRSTIRGGICFRKRHVFVCWRSVITHAFLSHAKVRCSNYEVLANVRHAVVLSALKFSHC